MNKSESAPVAPEEVEIVDDIESSETDDEYENPLDSEDNSGMKLDDPTRRRPKCLYITTVPGTFLGWEFQCGGIWMD